MRQRSDSVLMYLAVISAVGCGLNAGVFFAFSNFVIPAFARLPVPQGIAAMQSVNVTVENPLFAVVIFGTAAVCLYLAAVALRHLDRPASRFQLIGSVLYLGVAMVATFGSNVPLNYALAKVSPLTTEGARFWQAFLQNWMLWNYVRTAGAEAAAVFLTLTAISLTGRN
jgi:uncharacterized membrane protein